VDAEFLRELGRYVCKLVLPIAAALAAAWFIPSPRIGGEITGRILHLVSQSLAFGSVFGVLCILMREPESMRLVSQIRSAASWFRRHAPSESPCVVR